ncbi:MAG: U32 family peptidase [Lachnospiraceae bacterium]|nr:U32 family peptidase [Lachnospiraceae bacterium]
MRWNVWRESQRDETGTAGSRRASGDPGGCDRRRSGRLYSYIKPFNKHGLDAIIVQDYGVFQFVKRFFQSSGLHKHADFRCQHARRFANWSRVCYTPHIEGSPLRLRFSTDLRRQHDSSDHRSFKIFDDLPVYVLHILQFCRFSQTGR